MSTITRITISQRITKLKMHIHQLAGEIDLSDDVAELAALSAELERDGDKWWN